MKKTYISKFKSVIKSRVAYFTATLVMLLGVLPTTQAQNSRTPGVLTPNLVVCPASSVVCNTKVYGKHECDTHGHSHNEAGSSAPSATAAPSVLRKTANIIVNYNGFTPEAQNAFQYAVDIWASEIVSEVPIVINANFLELDPGVLGSAGTTRIYNNFAEGIEPDTWYPAALADAIAGENVEARFSDPGDDPGDIVCNFSSVFNWYYGTDLNPAADQFDFVTVVLHELGHGFGFFGFRNFDADTGIGGMKIQELDYIYNKRLTEGNDATNPVFLTSFEDPSLDIGRAFTNNNLYLQSPAVNAEFEGPAQIFAPTAFAGGSSVSHWDEAAYPPGTPNSLMTPQLGFQEANHNIGQGVRGLFEEWGYVINQEPTARFGFTAVVYPTTPGENCEDGVDLNQTNSSITIEEGTPFCLEYRVTNAGDAPLVNEIVVSDDFTGGVVLQAGNGTPSDTLLPPGQTLARAYTVNPSPELTTILSDLSITYATSASETGTEEFTTSSAVNVIVNRLPEISFPAGTAVAATQATNFDEPSAEVLPIVNTGKGASSFLMTIREIANPNANASTVAPEAFTTFNSALKIKGDTSNGILVDTSSELPNEAALEAYDIDLPADIFAQGIFNQGFEGLPLGAIAPETGLNSSSPLNVISDETPANGGQHLRLNQQTGAGITTLFTPTIPASLDVDAYRSFSMNVRWNGEADTPGTQFSIVPSNSEAGLGIASQFNILGDGRVFVRFGTGDFAPIDYTFPANQYVNLIYTFYAGIQEVYADGQLIFRQLAMQPRVDRLIYVGFNPGDAAVFDVDDVQYILGDILEPTWVTYLGHSGEIAPESNAVLPFIFRPAGLANGNYSAVAFYQDLNGAVPVTPININLEVVSGVATFNLIDARRDVPLFELSTNINDTTIVDLRTLGVRRVDVQAVPSTEVGSVKFEGSRKRVKKFLFWTLRENEQFNKVDNDAPYALFGDYRGNYWGRWIRKGDYAIGATPFSEDHAQGDAGRQNTAYFKVIKSDRNSTPDEILPLTIVSACSDFPQVESTYIINNPNKFVVHTEITFANGYKKPFQALPGDNTCVIPVIADVENSLTVSWLDLEANMLSATALASQESCLDGTAPLQYVVAPNPIVSGTVGNIYAKATTGADYQVRFINAYTGKQTLLGTFVPDENGSMDITYNAGDFGPGLYIVKIEGNGEAVERRLFIVH